MTRARALGHRQPPKMLMLVLLGVGVTAASVLATRARLGGAAQASPAARSEGHVLTGTGPPSGHALPAPRFVTPARERPQGLPEELDDHQREQLARLDVLTRARGAAAAGLTSEEAARVTDIEAQADGRRADLEAQMTSRDGRLARGMMARLRVNELRAFGELADVLGPERARQLRETEYQAYLELWGETFANETTAAKVIARRRLLVRQPPTGPAGYP